METKKVPKKEFELSGDFGGGCSYMANIYLREVAILYTEFFVFNNLENLINNI